MRIGKYQIGRYHAIIKKTYEDGSIDYETSFTDQADLMESALAIRQCLGRMVGLATDNPKVLTHMVIISGIQEITKELENAK